MIVVSQTPLAQLWPPLPSPAHPSSSHSPCCGLRKTGLDWAGLEASYKEPVAMFHLFPAENLCLNVNTF